MRTVIYGSLVLFGLGSVAVAQEHPSSHTLDEQLSRVQQGQPAVSGDWSKGKKAAPAQETPAVPLSASGDHEWPANPALAQRKPVNKQAPVPPADMGEATPIPDDTVAQQGGWNNPYIDSVGGGAIPALPLRAVTSGSVTYITGGIGDEEMEQLKSQESQYNLRVLMSAKGGEYISEVALRIVDAKGAEVLNVPSSGPYFYAKLPDGNYTVEMTSRVGETKKTNVKVSAKGLAKQSVVFAE